jgi:hypothetical protein
MLKPSSGSLSESSPSSFPRPVGHSSDANCKHRVKYCFKSTIHQRTLSNSSYNSPTACFSLPLTPRSWFQGPKSWLRGYKSYKSPRRRDRRCTSYPILGSHPGVSLDLVGRRDRILRNDIFSCGGRYLPATRCRVCWT